MSHFLSLLRLLCSGEIDKGDEEHVINPFILLKLKKTNLKVSLKPFQKHYKGS